MKKVIYTILFALSTTFVCGQELSLFNSKGTPVAYVNTDDDDLAIYLWSGKPVAYISSGNVYGFNGKHLGWWDKGIIRDHDGNAIGAIKSAFSGNTDFEPFKGLKQLRPLKGFKEYAPYKPYWTNYWSGNSFKLFLLEGVDN